MDLLGTYISTLDLSQAYFQISLVEESREINAFNVPGKGLYLLYVRADRSAHNAYWKLMGPEMEPYAFSYLDDIVIVTLTFKEHLEWLERVLNKIMRADLIINSDKCEFCRSQIRSLGFVATRQPNSRP